MLAQGTRIAAADSSGSRALPRVRHRPHALRQRRGARRHAQETGRSRGFVVRLHADVQMGCGRRPSAEGIAGTPGAQPEWFYKGDGDCVVGCGQALPSPAFALDGGEEPEIVGLYLIAPDGTPQRLGFAIGNEFSRSRHRAQELPVPRAFEAAALRHRPGVAYRRAAGSYGRHEPHPPRRAHPVGAPVPHRREQHVPHAGQSRVPPFQIHGAPAPGRCAPAFLRHRHVELRRRHRRSAGRCVRGRSAGLGRAVAKSAGARRGRFRFRRRAHST